MKKVLAGLVLAGAAAFNANASVIMFDDSTFGGTGSVLFDGIDFDEDVATVNQTDTNGNGSFAGGPDQFTEFGQTILVNFKNSGNPNFLPPNYEIFFDYSFSGIAELVAPFLQANFTGGTGNLWIDQSMNGVSDVGTRVSLGTYQMQYGYCMTSLAGSGFCDITLKFNANPGYFYYGGNDLSLNNAVYSKLIVTVQDIEGLSINYNGVPGSTETFFITHDGNQSYTVPEPASLAILGLGLLGLRLNRRNKN